MAITLTGQQPALAAGPADWHLKPQVDTAVPVRGPARATVPGGGPAAALNRPAPVWPAAGSGRIAVPGDGATAAGRAAIGGLPVTVGPPATPRATGRSASESVSRVQVEVIDRARTDTAGVRGVLLRVGRIDGVDHPGRARISVDYRRFRYAHGADWALRLRLVQLPACALTTPELAACGGRALPSSNDPAAGVVSADVDIPAADQQAPATGTLLALQAGPSSGAGSYAATTLQPSSVWSAGGSSGDFSWSYPLRVPPPLGGPAPRIALAYSSQSVDGRMAASNNQPSWIGEGFEWSPGFVERRYKPCGKDMGAGANNTTETGDLCWVRDNATMSLNGRSTELLFVAGQEWRGRSDDATRVRKQTGGGNGDNNGESWVATTTDGTQYFFGSTTAGTWTAPVFGNHAGEPCHGTAFIDSDCTQAWRWMLDKVVDPNGNTMTFTWVKETNKYARNATATDAADYTRGGYLQRIEYGTRSGVAGTAPMRVEIAVADRCVTTSCATHDENNWPDTAWDLQCTGSPCTIGSPTFWTTKRLFKITTQLWVSGTTYRDVETWTLSHSFPSPGDGTRAGLWLDMISHSGKIGSTTTTVPDITFDRVQMPNRVDSTQGDWAQAMKWWRISQIHTETGGSINVTYKPADCSAPGGLPAQPHNNTQRCYPVKWIPEGLTAPVTDWFHKYVVDTVTESDLVGGADPVSHSYQYLGGAAWRYTDDDGLIADEDKTWSVWRGYATVRTTVGAAPEVQQVTESRYFRGMHGDHQPPLGTRTVVLPAVGSYAPAVNDEDHFAGVARETIVYGGATEVSAQVTEPWRSAANATRTIVVSTVEARHTGTAHTWRRVALDGGRPARITQTSNVFGSYGLVEKTTDHGDIAATGDEGCTLTTYTPSDTVTWLLSYPQRVRTFATTCAVAESGNTLSVDDVIGDVRTWYDDTTSFGTAPAMGNPTKVEVLKTWTPGPGGGNPGTPGYLVTTITKHDAWGRVIESTDVKNNKTTTVYTHNSAGQLASTASTNQLSWTTTTTYDPGWGVVTKTVDPNGRVTEQTYDGLARVTGVWLPGRDKTAGASASMIYSYAVNKTAPTVTTTARLIPGGTYSISTILYDGLLRNRQSQAPEGTTAGGRIVTEQLYDSAGRPFKKRGPYIAEGPPGTGLVLPVSESVIPGVTTAVFDGAGRTTNAIYSSMGAELWRTVTGYGGDRIDVQPPAGGTATSTVTDTRGNTVKLYQYHGTAPTPTVAGSWDETSYTFNRKSQLTQVHDPTGNTWTNGYDLRGRPTTNTDPDRGSTTSVYNDAGELVSTTDARGEVLAYTYDILGRKTSLRDDTPTGPKRAEWTYDAITGDTVPGGSVKGKAVKTTRYDPAGSTNAYVSEFTGFNTDYTPTGTIITMPSVETGLAGSYAYTHTYWEQGSPSTTRLPDIDGSGGLTAETLTFRYNHVGLPETLGTNYGGTATKYVIGTTYTRFGEPTLTGMRFSTGKGVEQARHYATDGTRRLTRIISSRETSPSGVTDLNYNYDPAGNVTKITDLTPNPDDIQCLSYDYLRRLTTAWTPASGDCPDAPTVAGLGGPAPYWHSWTFDTVGNRTSQVEHAATDTTRAYIHPAPGGPKPHTLTSVTATGGATGTQNYSYDATGNTTCRPSGTGPNTCPPGSGSQTLTWDAEGHLAASADASGTTSYIYDADGNRLVRRDPSGRTLYLPGQELRHITSSNTKATTRYYSHNGVAIGSRTATVLTWLSTDHQNTASFAITATSTQPVTTRRQTPYGNIRGAAPSWPDPRGYLGGTKDNTGTTHLGAREYDPTIGRFLSVDPVADKRDPQQMHGYSYARNTPVTVPDPTGLRVCLEACLSHDDRQAMAIRKENDHTRRHDAARDWAAAMITVQVALSGGDPTKVTIEMNVPGGSKTKGSTADGSADIVYVDEKAGVVYVWEVKKGTVGSTSAGRDIQTYRPYMAKDPRFRGMDIRPGFSLAVPPSGVVVPSPHPNEALRIYNGTQPGAILYDVVASPPPPGPVHVRVPDRVPVPVPAPHPRPVPYAAPTPPQAPTPAPLPTPFIPLHPGGIPPELVVALVTFGVVIIGACIAAAPVCIGGVALGGGAAAVATS